MIKSRSSQMDESSGPGAGDASRTTLTGGAAMSRPLRICLCFCFLALALPLASVRESKADALYGSTTGSPGGGQMGGGPSYFYSIDPTTGAGTLIGAIGFDDVGAMAFHPVTRTIYAAGKRHIDRTPVLITIDPVTGAGTEIGPIGPGRGVSDMAFRPSDNTLFAHRINCPNLIYTIDVQTGAGTIVGDVLTTYCEGGDGLAFSSTNTLYLAGTYNGGSGPYTLYAVNQSNGATTRWVSLTYPASFGAFARANAMKFDPTTGVLVASVTTSFGGGGPNYLATIDVATGTVTEIGPTVTDLDGLVFTKAIQPMGFDFTPNTLNLKSLGHWVTGVLEPEPPALPADINVASVLLNGSVPVDVAAPTSIGDADNDGRPDLTVKFDRAAADLTIEEGDSVTVKVTGVIGDQTFEGTDVIRAMRGHVSAPIAGTVLQAGSTFEVLWTTPANVQVQSVAVLSSLDDGATWNPVASDLPNSGSYLWTVPIVSSDQARIAVVLVESAGQAGDDVEGVIGVSDRFAISTLLGVIPTNVGFALHGAVPNPSRGLNVSFSLTDAEPATLRVFDVGGREVSVRQVGSLGSGRHVVSLGTLRPGVYLVHLIQGSRRLIARAVVIQ